jgi:hypothetical protein
MLGGICLMTFVLTLGSGTASKVSRISSLENRGSVVAGVGRIHKQNMAHSISMSSISSILYL